MKHLLSVVVIGLGISVAVAAEPYDYFRNVQYPRTRRQDVGLDRVEQAGGPDAVGYNKRVVQWWPKKGVDVVDIPEGVQLRTWTIRSPESTPLIEAGYYAKWWPDDLKGKKQFDAHLIGFRGVGSKVGDPFGDKAKLLALGKGVCPAVVLRLSDGRKRCFSRGSFSDEDQTYIQKLYDKEMKRIRKTLEPPPTGRRAEVESMKIAKLNEIGMYRQSGVRFVITSGSQEADDGIPGSWINERRPTDAAIFRKSTFDCLEDYWTYLEYAGHKMPYWERPGEDYRYYITWNGTRRNGGKTDGRGNGGGYARCGTACWEGLYHEWGHGTANSQMSTLSIGWGETLCDSLQTVADPTLVRKVMFGIRRPYKNPFRGHYPGGFGYIMMSEDPNWGYVATVTFTDLASPAEETPMHIMARLGQDRGIWKNGIKGVGDFMGQIAARMAEYDYEIESIMREAYPQPNRAYLVALDKSKGLYRSTRTEAPEPFGNNIIRLVVKPGAKKIIVDFQGIFDADTYSDWRACIVAVDANGRPRYSPLWNKGKMNMDILPGDKRYWLTVTATPYALCGGGGNAHGIYDGGFTYKYPYEVQLSGCRPANPNAPIGVNENMELIGPALIARADNTENTCGRGDWPHPSDTPEYEKMKRTLEVAAAKGPVMMERFSQEGLFTGSPFCPIMGRNGSHIKSVASAAFLTWRANWLLENAQGARHPNGGGWVARSATVAPTAYVGPDCMVLDGAKVLDNAIIEEYAMISGPKVLIKDNARVYGKAVVCGDVTLSGYARVCRTLYNRQSKVRLVESAPGYTFQMSTGAPIKRDGPEERVEVYKDAGFKLQANYAFDRPETVLLEDWYQEHSVDGSQFGAHSEDLIFYDGVLYGKPGFEKQGDVRAFTFNGSDQYAEAEGALADLGAITVDARIKPALGKQQTVFDFGSSVENRFMLSIDPLGKPVLTVVTRGKAKKIASSKRLESGQWSSCRVEIDGQRIRLWVNNEKVADQASAFRAADAFPGGVEKRNYIAATRDHKDFFKGSIDHVRVYFTVYDDFTEAPEPPLVSSRRIAPGFVERFEKAYAGYSDLEARFRDAMRTNETQQFYKGWSKKVADRMAELQSSDEVTALEKKLRLVESQLGERKRQLHSGFDQDPKNVAKRKRHNELERKRRARFEELRDANPEITALRKKAGETRKITDEVIRSARAAHKIDIDAIQLKRRAVETRRNEYLKSLEKRDAKLVENRAKHAAIMIELRATPRDKNRARHDELRKQERQSNDRFYRRRDALARSDSDWRAMEQELHAFHKQERDIIESAARKNPRYQQARDDEKKTRDRLGKLERQIWREGSVKALEVEMRKFNPWHERNAYVEDGTRAMITEINRLQAAIKELRVETALSRRPDEYLALSALVEGNRQYRDIVSDHLKKRMLPPMSENRRQLETSWARQQEPWHTRVNWDRRTRWEQPGMKMKPIMKRWLDRQRGAIITADQTGGK